MPTLLYVFLYQNGKNYSFADLSGPEAESIIDVVESMGWGDLDLGDDPDSKQEYATIEVEDENVPGLLGKKRVNPRQYGVNSWAQKVELEFSPTLTTRLSQLPQIKDKVAKREERQEARKAIDETLTKNTPIPEDLFGDIKKYAVGYGRRRKTRKGKKASKKSRKTRGRK